MLPSETVLLVEPEGPDRRLDQARLDEAGFNILLADNAHDAIRIMADLRPDVVVLEWILRDGESREVLLRAVEQPFRIPIIIYTWYKQAQESYHAVLADRILMKSSHENRLVEVIHEYFVGGRLFI